MIVMAVVDVDVDVVLGFANCLLNKSKNTKDHQKVCFNS